MTLIAVLVHRTGHHLFDSLRIKSLEWVCTLAGMLFGYSLIQPADTFGLSPSYAVMALTVDRLGLTEDSAGIWIMVLAAIRFCVLGYNGLWHSSPIARRWMSFLFALLWCVIFIGFWSAVGFASTGSVYLAFLIGEAFNTIRTSFEVGRMPTIRKGRAVHAGDTGN